MAKATEKIEIQDNREKFIVGQITFRYRQGTSNPNPFL